MNLFDTLDNKRKNINLSEKKKIKIYVCGITPYSESHIGHAMSAVIFDTLRKYLLANKQNVIYVQNFTDIDDKLIQAAEENNSDIRTISTKFINKHDGNSTGLVPETPKKSNTLNGCYLCYQILL